MKKIVLLTVAMPIILVPILIWRMQVPSGWQDTRYNSGAIKQHAYYASGKIEGTVTEYYENGSIKMEAVYKNGKLQGTVTTFYMDGPIKSHKPYKNGVPHGVAREYFMNENIKSEIHYVNGVKHGVESKYYGTGDILGRAFWANGKQQGERELFTRSGRRIAQLPAGTETTVSGTEADPGDGSTTSSGSEETAPLLGSNGHTSGSMGTAS